MASTGKKRNCWPCANPHAPAQRRGRLRAMSDQAPDVRRDRGWTMIREENPTISIGASILVVRAVKRMQANFRGDRIRKAKDLLVRSSSYRVQRVSHRRNSIATGVESSSIARDERVTIHQAMAENEARAHQAGEATPEQIAKAEEAAYYVEDAFAGRLKNGKAVMWKNRDAFTFRCFNIHVHHYWTWAVIGANLLHTALTLLEPPRTYAAPATEQFATLGPLISLLEWVCICVYLADIILKSWYQGAETFFSYSSGKKWQMIYAISVMWMTVDAVVRHFAPSGTIMIRFSRPLRPLVMMLRSRAVRRFYTVVVDMLHDFILVLLPIIFFLVAYATFAARFVDDESQFSNSFAAFQTFFVLIFTTDNYTEVFTALHQSSLFGGLAFYVFLVVGLLFLVAFLFGITYDAYTEHTQKQVKDERMKELKGLTKAFAVLDTKMEGQITIFAWKRLMSHLRPDLTSLESCFLFDVLAGNGVIDFVDFYGMRKVLNYHFLNHDYGDGQYAASALGRAKHAPSLSMTTFMMTRARNTLRHSWFAVFQKCLCILDASILLFDVECRPFQWFAVSERLPQISIGEVIGIVLLIELATKIAVSGSVGAYWFSQTPQEAHPKTRVARRIDMVLILLSTVPMWLLPWHSVFPQVPRCSWSVLRIWRCTIFVNRLVVFFRCFVTIFPALMQTIGFAFVVMYFYAVIGMELMGGDVEALSNFPSAMYMMIKLLFAVDYLESVADCEKIANPVLVHVYFMSHFLVGAVIVVNLITALMIEFFHHAKEVAKEPETNSKRDEITVDNEAALMRKVQAAHLLGLSDQKKMVVNSTGSAQTLMEMRKKFGLGQDMHGISIKDLKKCQDQANPGFDLETEFRKRQARVAKEREVEKAKQA